MARKTSTAKTPRMVNADYFEGYNDGYTKGFEIALALAQKSTAVLFSELRASPPNKPAAMQEPLTLSTPIEALNLGIKSYNILRRADVQTVGDLAAMYANQLIELPQFGDGSVAEVIAALQRHGFMLAGAFGPPEPEEGSGDVDAGAQIGRYSGMGYYDDDYEEK